MRLQTIQKTSKDSGISPDSIRKMIKNKRIIAYKQNEFKKIMVDMDSFYSSFKPINNVCKEFDLENFMV